MISQAAELLAAGRFAEGFALYARWQEGAEYQRASARLTPIADFCPPWRGEDLAGRNLLVISEQGLGDQVMYARFVPLLRERGASVAWLCPGTLARLLAHGLGIPTLAAEGTVNLPRPDFHVFSSGLAPHFFPPLQAPTPPPYLVPPPPTVAPGLRIGIAPSGNPNHPTAALRSLTERDYEALMAIPGAVSLLPHHLGARDYYDTATVMAGLDLVISVDSSAAHVAAAMGRPTWVLLPERGFDWRWADGRASPWYPQARLLRQARLGDWSDVVAAVRAELG